MQTFSESCCWRIQPKKKKDYLGEKEKTEALGHMEYHLRETSNIQDKDKDLGSNWVRW